MASATQTLLYLFLSLILCSSPLKGQITDMKTYQLMWENQEYLELVISLRKIRNEPGWRNALSDYYLATSYCRIDGQEEKADNYFNWLSSQYSLPGDFRDKINLEQQKCPATDKPTPIASLDELKTLHGPVVDFSAKTFTPLDGSYERKPVTVSRIIEPEEYRSRLFRADDREKAIEALENILDEKIGNSDIKFQVIATEHFLLVGTQESAGFLEEAGGMLERTLKFFQKEFGMAEPPYLVTTYLLTEAWQLESVADELHGLDVDKRFNIGYTSHEDQSVVALTPQRLFGTLNHELFHLLSHLSFGDIPAWIDEGMAALFEVSGSDGENIIGRHNWRGPVLRKYWDLRPTIEELTEVDWAALQRGDFRGNEEAAIFATARYFFLYLQDKQKKLGQVYQALQSLNPETINGGPKEATKRVLEQELGMNLKEINADYEKWVKPIIGI